MMTIIADKNSIRIDLGSSEVRHGEMTTDVLRMIQAVLIQMERVENFDENKSYVRQRQYEALEVWKNAILGLEIGVEEDLTTKEQQQCRRVVEEFMAQYQAASREEKLS